MNIEVAYFSRPRYLFKVDRSAYFPVPKCDGAMVDFELRPAAARPQLPMTDAQFLGLVRLCNNCCVVMRHVQGRTARTAACAQHCNAANLL